MVDPETRTDLTDLLARVASGELAWPSPDAFNGYLSDLAIATPGGKVDWDDGAGEEWGMIMEGRARVVLVLVRARVAFVRESSASGLAEIFDRYAVVTEVVKAWDAQRYRADPEILARAFSPWPIEEDVDFESLSVNDIWWATV